MFKKDVEILTALEMGDLPLEEIKKHKGIDSKAIHGVNSRGYIVNRIKDGVGMLTITAAGSEALTEHKKNVKKK